MVFRLVGVPSCGGWPAAWNRPLSRRTQARLARDVASMAGRLDVVQVSLRDGMAEPLFGPSALLSVLARADGYVVVPEPATGLDGGSPVQVTLYR